MVVFGLSCPLFRQEHRTIHLFVVYSWGYAPEYFVQAPFWSGSPATRCSFAEGSPMRKRAQSPNTATALFSTPPSAWLSPYLSCVDIPVRSFFSLAQFLFFFSGFLSDSPVPPFFAESLPSPGDDSSFTLFPTFPPKSGILPGVIYSSSFIRGTPFPTRT